MEAFEGFSPQDLERWKAIAELQKKASSSINGYYETMKLLKELEANLRHISKEKLKTENKLAALLEKEAELKKDSRYMTNAEYQQTLKQIKLEQKKLDIAEEMLRLGESNVRLLSEQLNSTNLLVASTRSLVGGLKAVGTNLSANLDYWLEQQKAAKMAGFSMGVLSKQSAAFRDNLYKASLTTNTLGVDTKLLSQMQAAYSEQVGRAVQLSEDGLIAMSELANGTVLGAEGAARLASDMESFNVSAVRGRDIVEEMLNNAHKMGVDGARATRELEKNLRLANRYHFKGGIEGLSKMVNLATKFKIEMGDIAAFADKVFDIEGAVDMAAQLQVLGGGWSKLGDPFQLMFKARNDIEGLTKDIIAATDVTGQFNKTTGEFEITALELSRLREVAKATGLDFDMLSESAKTVAKNAQIKGKVTGFFSDDEKEFIASLAQYDNKKKTYTLRIDGSDIPVEEMHKFNKAQLKAIREEKASLEERGKDSQTFDESWKNIVNTVKSAFLPGFEAFSNAFSGGLKGFQDWMKTTGFLEKVTSWGKSLGEFAAAAVKWVAENPIKTMLIGATALLAKEATWFLRGQILGAGFNSVAGAGGSGGGGMLGTGIGSRTSAATRGGRGLSGRMGRVGRGMAGKGAGIAALGGLGSMAIDYGRGQMDNPDSEWGKALGVGSTALAWGATGAMIGSVVPLIGTAAGAVIGGLAGAVKGAFDEYGDKAESKFEGNAGGYDMGQVNNDFIARPGSDPIPFNSADTLVGLKKDGGIGRALVENGTSSGKNMEIKFTNALRIDGNINVTSPDKSATINLDDPLFIRQLTQIIQEQISRNIGGGKISSNPV